MLVLKFFTQTQVLTYIRLPNKMNCWNDYLNYTNIVGVMHQIKAKKLFLKLELKSKVAAQILQMSQILLYLLWKSFVKKNKFPSPTFVVIQTGTRVMEMRNVGSFDSPLRIFNEIPSEIQVPKMIEICKKYNIFMKEHIQIIFLISHYLGIPAQVFMQQMLRQNLVWLKPKRSCK